MTLKEFVYAFNIEGVEPIVSWTFDKGIELKDLLDYEDQEQYEWLWNSKVYTLTKTDKYDLVIKVGL